MNRVLAVVMWSLAVAVCLGLYVTGRFSFSSFSVLLVPLAYLLAFGSYTVAAFAMKQPWSHRARKVALAGASLVLIYLPVFFGDSYVEMGRRDHLKNLFSPDLIADVKQRVRGVAFSSDRGSLGDIAFETLTPADLPPAVSTSSWGSPEYASYSYSAGTGTFDIHLQWGGPLVGRYGLVITDQDVPFHEFPVFGGSDDKPVYPERFYPLKKGAYIVLGSH